MRSGQKEINGVIYIIYENGEVYGPNGLISQRPNTSGYASFTAGKKGLRTRKETHKLVAELFLPNPSNLPEIDHLDANRMNPSVDNLEWVTHQENIRRAQERGNYKGRYVGEDNPKSRLNEALVKQMIVEYRAGAAIQQLVDKYGYPWSTIGNAVKGITWGYLQ